MSGLTTALHVGSEITYDTFALFSSNLPNLIVFIPGMYWVLETRLLSTTFIVLIIFLYLNWITNNFPFICSVHLLYPLNT